MRVYRIQDAGGRGPWRPGFSRVWCDKDFGPGVENLPPWGVEFGADLIERRGLPGEHYGCAVRKPQELRRWVSDTERARLAALGFNVVSVKADRILAESKNQMVFASRTPLARAAVVIPWDALVPQTVIGDKPQSQNTESLNTTTVAAEAGERRGDEP